MEYGNKKGVTLQTRKNETTGNWVAEIGISGINKKTKNFAVRKYGYDEAQKMAFYQRLIFEIERNKKSEDYDYFCYELMKEIADFYNYEMNVITDIDMGVKKTIIITDGDSTFKYNNIDEALMDWYETLVESDKCCVNEKVGMYWEQERKFIKTLIDIKK